MIQDYLEGVTFNAGSNYTVLSDKIAKISTIVAGGSVTLTAKFTAGSDVVKDYVNTVELTGAIANNYYYLDTTKDYKVSAHFKVANVDLKINLKIRIIQR